MLAVATLGVLVPFFYYNVFGDPEKQQKKIFMGERMPNLLFIDCPPVEVVFDATNYGYKYSYRYAGYGKKKNEKCGSSKSVLV